MNNTCQCGGIIQRVDNKQRGRHYYYLRCRSCHTQVKITQEEYNDFIPFKKNTISSNPKCVKCNNFMPIWNRCHYYCRKCKFYLSMKKPL
jgi:hypothetical protein